MSTPESRIIITADVSKVSEGFARVEAEANRLTGALGKVGREGFKGIEQSARQGLGGLQNQLSGLTSVVTRVAGALALLGGAGAVIGGLRQVINELDALNDTADATGASIENLSALEAIGRRVGTSFDTVSSILVKFNAQLQDAGDPASTAAQALQAIGLSAEELRRLDPAEALQRTAVALSGYADDANKARLVQELFGKSVREAAPFLKDLAEAGQLNATATAAQAQEAERFNKLLAEADTNINALKRSILNGLLPAFNNMVSRMREEGGFFAAFWKDRQVEFAGDEARRASGAQGRAIQELQKLMDAGGGDANASPYTKLRVRELREEIDSLGRKALAASERVKSLLGTGSARAQADAAPEAEKPSVDFQPQPKKEGPTGKPAGSAIARLSNPLSPRQRARSIGSSGVEQFLRDFERRQEQAAQFGEQLREQTEQINVSLIEDDRARGEAQIELDRRVMQSRIDTLRIGGVDMDAAQQALNANILARQASLTEALKPEWQRMFESWQDTTRQMSEAYDDIMGGVLTRTEDVIAGFIKTGRLSIRSLADFVIGEIARMQARMLAAQLFNLAGDLTISVLGAAKGAAFHAGGVRAFASGGIVDKPTFFGYAGGKTGLMGEAGPEAIMPLTRGPDGKLGVKTHGGGPSVNVTINAQAGVSRAELAAMLPMIREQLKAELVGSMRRPGFAG